MPIYEWVCHDCKIYWERECSIGKAPDRTRCPECRKLSNRHFDGSINVKWGDDMAFHTHRQRVKKVAEKGWDKTAAHKFYNNAIDGTKERLKDERGRYTSVNLNYGKMADDGLFERVSDEEAGKRRETQKKMAEEAYNNANNLGYRQHDGSKLDITKPHKQN